MLLYERRQVDDFTTLEDCMRQGRDKVLELRSREDSTAMVTFSRELLDREQARAEREGTAADRTTVKPNCGHTDWVWAVQFSDDGSQIISASSDGSVRIWDANRASRLTVPWDPVQEEAKVTLTTFTEMDEERIFDGCCVGLFNCVQCTQYKVTTKHIKLGVGTCCWPCRSKLVKAKKVVPLHAIHTVHDSKVAKQLLVKRKDSRREWDEQSKEKRIEETNITDRLNTHLMAVVVLESVGGAVGKNDSRARMQFHRSFQQSITELVDRHNQVSDLPDLIDIVSVKGHEAAGGKAVHKLWFTVAPLPPKGQELNEEGLDTAMVMRKLLKLHAEERLHIKHAGRSVAWSVPDGRAERMWGFQESQEEAKEEAKVTLPTFGLMEVPCHTQFSKADAENAFKEKTDKELYMRVTVMRAENFKLGGSGLGWHCCYD